MGVLVKTPMELAFAAVNEAEADLLVKMKVCGLMVGYERRWGHDEYRSVPGGVEQQFVTEILNPETGKASRTFKMAGKRDGVVAYQGQQKFLRELKTTSEDISPVSSYWAHLRIDGQVSTYYLTHWQEGEKLDGTLYDVVRKPAIKPKQIPKGSGKKSDEENVGTLVEICDKGTYYGGDVPAGTIPDEESPYLYYLRLCHEVTVNAERYYQRKSVPRLDSDIAEFAQELWDIAKEINEAIKTGRHYRNSDACMVYGRPCEFLGICSGNEDIDCGKWVKRKSVHNELEGVGANCLTISRIRCFQTCRRKHHLYYNVGITRYDEEETEALALGKLLHLAQEVWWGARV
jgi:hypothetical protein